MLKSTYLTEHALKDFGFKSLGTNVRISTDARIYGEKNISIGSNVRIDDFAILSAASGQITIGNYVFIARSAHLNGRLGIEIKDFSCVTANVAIHSASDDYSGETMTAEMVPAEFKNHQGGKVILHRHAIVGCASVIFGPAEIGEGCSIGAMSLVKESLAPWGIYAGIPARRIKERKKKLLELEQDFLKRSV